MFLKINEYIERFFNIISSDCKRYFENAIDKKLYQKYGKEKCFSVIYQNKFIHNFKEPCLNRVKLRSSELFDIIEKIQEEEKEFNNKKIARITITMSVRSEGQTYSKNYYMTGMTRVRDQYKIVDLKIFVPESELLSFDYGKFEKYLYGIAHHEFSHALLQKDFFQKSTFLSEDDPDYNILTKNRLKVLSDEEEVFVRMPEEVVGSIKSLYPFLNHASKTKIEYWFQKNEIDAHVNHIMALSLFNKRLTGMSLDNLIEEETDIWLDSIEETKNIKIPVSFSEELGYGASKEVKFSGILNSNLITSQKLLNDALISLGYELSESQKSFVNKYLQSIEFFPDVYEAEEVSNILSEVILKIISDNLEKAIRFNISRLIKKNASLFILRDFLAKEGFSSELRLLDSIS
ncbi:hypothetical protein N9W84_00745 [bacterium]|nr:hypothetical protein [bacterium]